MAASIRHAIEEPCPCFTGRLLLGREIVSLRAYAGL